MPAASSGGGQLRQRHGTSTVAEPRRSGSYNSTSGRPATTAAHMKAATGYDRSCIGN